MRAMEVNAEIRSEILKSVDGLSNDELNKKVDAEKWTIAQVLEHLYFSEEVVTKSLVYGLEKGNSEPVESKPVHLVADRSQKRQAPDYVLPKEDYISLEEIKEKLHRSREKLNAVVYEAGGDVLKTRSLKHPVFGPLNLYQWVEFIGMHEKRHLNQIEELKEQLLMK
ncbi:MAG: DinB family protein [Tuberibacillus sp.]